MEKLKLDILQVMYNEKLTNSDAERKKNVHEQDPLPIGQFSQSHLTVDCRNSLKKITLQS